jgi:hypothetical protein
MYTPLTVTILCDAGLAQFGVGATISRRTLFNLLQLVPPVASWLTSLVDRWSLEQPTCSFVRMSHARSFPAYTVLTLLFHRNKKRWTGPNPER